MKKLAVFFPGIGYTADMPLLYYSRRLAAGFGYEIRLLNYGGFPEGVRGDRDKMAACYRLALRQSTEMLSGVDWEGYDDIVFIGKSIGTILAAWFSVKSPAKDRIRLVLYTPMEDAFPFVACPAIAFTGTADPWVGGEDSAIPALCGKKGVPCLVLPGADHSLQTGNVPEDIKSLRRVMEATERFLRGEEGRP